MFDKDVYCYIQDLIVVLNFGLKWRFIEISTTERIQGAYNMLT